MPSAASLLRDPPEAFRLAMQGLHQDIDVICEAEGITRAQHMIDFVGTKGYPELQRYLNAILSDDRISNADLKGLLNRHDTDVHVRKSSDVRALFVSLSDELKARLKTNG